MSYVLTRGFALKQFCFCYCQVDINTAGFSIMVGELDYFVQRGKYRINDGFFNANKFYGAS